MEYIIRCAKASMMLGTSMAPAAGVGMLRVSALIDTLPGCGAGSPGGGPPPVSTAMAVDASIGIRVGRVEAPRAGAVRKEAARSARPPPAITGSVLLQGLEGDLVADQGDAPGAVRLLDAADGHDLGAIEAQGHVLDDGHVAVASAGCVIGDPHVLCLLY